MEWNWWPFAKRNLETPKRPALVWRDDKAIESLDAMYTSAEQFALDSATWYVRKKGWPARISRMSRGIAVVLLVFGMLTPLLASLPFKGMAVVTPFGYLALALAGSALLVDRFGSFSSAWMRYISTNMRIQRLLRTFQIDWQVGKAQLELETSKEQQRQKIFTLLGQIRDFTDKISQAVEDETSAWIAEFRDTLAELQRSISERQKAESGTGKTGSVRVMITNFATIGGPVQISVDGFAIAQMTAAERTITPVMAGSRIVMARAALKSGDWIEKSVTLEVPSGGEATATITLPLPMPPGGDDNIVKKEPEKTM